MKVIYNFQTHLKVTFSNSPTLVTKPALISDLHFPKPITTSVLLIP